VLAGLLVFKVGWLKAEKVFNRLKQKDPSKGVF